MKSLKSFLIQLIGLTIFVEIICAAWCFAMPDELATKIILTFPIFFAIITFFSHKILVNAIQKSEQQLKTTYTIVTTTKLLIIILVLFLFAIFYRGNYPSILKITFLITYVIYIAFEAVTMMKLNKE